MHTKNRHVKRLISVLLIISCFNLLLPVPLYAVVTATNGIYTLAVEDDAASGDGIGTFTVGTGAAHPFPGNNILFNYSDPWSTYLTVRSYTSGTDYVSTASSPTTSFTLANLDNFSPVVSAIGSTGYTTTWTVTGNDNLTIVQTTNIEGTGLNDSKVRVTTMVTNNGTGPVQIGIRYEWDWQIAVNDNSYIKRHNPTDPAFSNTFFEEVPPTFEYYEETDDLTTPTFSIFGTANGPASLSPAPTPPNRFNYSLWDDAFGNAWDFAVAGGNNDSAVCYYWGDTAANAITINSGQSYSVTQYITTAEVSLAPGISVNPTSLAFGCQEPNTSSTARIVTVTNTGTADLNIGTIAFTGSGFTKQNDNCSNQTLAPTGNCTLEVVFQPSAAGNINATLNIPSNLPTQTVQLSGTCGNCAAAPVSVPTMTEWGMIFMGLLFGGTAILYLRRRKNA
jgi:hypothetical protein